MKNKYLKHFILFICLCHCVYSNENLDSFGIIYPYFIVSYDKINERIVSFITQKYSQNSGIIGNMYYTDSLTRRRLNKTFYCSLPFDLNMFHFFENNEILSDSLKSITSYILEKDTTDNFHKNSLFFMNFNNFGERVKLAYFNFRQADSNLFCFTTKPVEYHFEYNGQFLTKISEINKNCEKIVERFIEYTDYIDTTEISVEINRIYNQGDFWEIRNSKGLIAFINFDTTNRTNKILAFNDYFLFKQTMEYGNRDFRILFFLKEKKFKDDIHCRASEVSEIFEVKFDSLLNTVLVNRIRDIKVFKKVLVYNILKLKFDENNRLIFVENENQKSDYKYNHSNKLEFEYNYNKENKLFEMCRYYYNTEGLLTKKEWSNDENKIIKEQIFEYEFYNKLGK